MNCNRSNDIISSGDNHDNSKPAQCVIATVAGEIIVVDISGGSVVARIKLPAEVFSSPVCMDGKIYVGCRNDRIYCLNFG